MTDRTSLFGLFLRDGQPDESDATMRTAKQRAAELKKLAALQDKDVDTSDIPEITDWTGMEVGRFYRPVKKQITLRIDADVLAWFKSRGAGYQSEINKVLRGHMSNNLHARAKKRIGSHYRALSGESCPVSGVWSVEEMPSQTISVAKGNRMPPFAGRVVVWVRKKAA